MVEALVFRERMYVRKLSFFTAIIANPNVVLITLGPHKAEPWCLHAAHEVAALISGSGWRASN